MEELNEIIILKIIYQNVNECNNKKFELYNILSSFHPNIIVINKHELNPEKDKIKFYNYETISKNTQQREYDGSAIEIRKGTSHHKIDSLEETFTAITFATPNRLQSTLSNRTLKIMAVEQIKKLKKRD